MAGSRGIEPFTRPVEFSEQFYSPRVGAEYNSKATLRSSRRDGRLPHRHRTSLEDLPSPQSNPSKVQGDNSPTSLSDNRPPSLENPSSDSNVTNECASDGVTVRFDQQDRAQIPPGIDHHFVDVLGINTTLDNARRMALENESLTPDTRYRLWPAWAIDVATRNIGDPATVKKEVNHAASLHHAKTAIRRVHDLRELLPSGLSLSCSVAGGHLELEVGGGTTARVAASGAATSNSMCYTDRSRLHSDTQLGALTVIWWEGFEYDTLAETVAGSHRIGSLLLEVDGSSVMAVVVEIVHRISASEELEVLREVFGSTHQSIN